MSPMGPYKDFQDCVRKNKNKEGVDDPKAYCAAIMRQVEGPNAGRNNEE